MEYKNKILVLSANPVNTDRLRLDEEVREIEEGLRRSKCREQFNVKCVLLNACFIFNVRVGDSIVIK